MTVCGVIGRLGIFREGPREGQSLNDTLSLCLVGAHSAKRVRLADPLKTASLKRAPAEAGVCRRSRGGNVSIPHHPDTFAHDIHSSGN